MSERNHKYRTIHVKADSSLKPDGTPERPFISIQEAANHAEPGDTVLVHGGVYRERVDPPRGGKNDNCRITFAAAEGEKAVIKGSERIQGWRMIADQVWQVDLPTSFFQGFNPYATPLKGDWLEQPVDWHLNLGQVYLNGKALYQGRNVDDLIHPIRRENGMGPDWVIFPLRHPHSEDTILQWCSEVDDNRTRITANFQSYDPNKEIVEINTRDACFLPRLTGIDYVTVRGFEMAQAACQWAPPTAEQTGVVGPHWSKGWIIEENDIHDARCSGISLGTDIRTGNNQACLIGDKPGYQYQLEGVFKARHLGWDMETVGSHLIRNNIIHDCGQAGIVGNMGCINSRIQHNQIFRIGDRYEFFGHEIAGIKLHAAIDTVISGNNIHDCTLGTWLDWQAQGTRVSANVYHHNVRDVMIEVTHGPCLFDNNIFGSAYNFDNAAQGTAFVHNLFCGSTRKITVPNRFTPYHLPHSTKLLGTVCVYGDDDRFLQNIFAGPSLVDGTDTCGTDIYNGAPTSMEEYEEKVHARDPGDVDIFEAVRQPVMIARNIYCRGSRPFDRETDPDKTTLDPQISIEEDKDGDVWCRLSMPELNRDRTELVTTENLGTPRITGEGYENPDGSPLAIDRDLTGTQRSQHPAPGPFEQVREGVNNFMVYSQNR